MGYERPLSADEEDRYVLLLPFDSDHSEFIRGFEVGRMWADLTSHERTEFTIHPSNLAMALRIGDALGMSVVSEDVSNDFVEVRFNL
jgi:hypothetical protein